MPIIDHQTQVRDLIISQYKNSQNLIGYINSFAAVSNDIEEVSEDLFNKFNLETAEGDFLDAIGQLLHVDRFPIVSSNEFFQFDVTPLDRGSRFRDGHSATYTLIDDLHYKRALKCWSITMNSIGNVNDIIMALSELFGIIRSLIHITERPRFQFDVTPLDGPYVLDWNYTYIDIFVDFVLDSQDISMYNYVTKCGSRLFPKLAGIQYNLTHL